MGAAGITGLSIIWRIAPALIHGLKAASFAPSSPRNGSPADLRRVDHHGKLDRGRFEDPDIVYGTAGSLMPMRSSIASGGDTVDPFSQVSGQNGGHAGD